MQVTCPTCGKTDALTRRQLAGRAKKPFYLYCDGPLGNRHQLAKMEEV